MNEITVKENDIIASVVLNGDISKLTEIDQVKYYNMFCESLGLNPVTQPFDIIVLNGKKRLYAKKDATEQLRKINGVSIIDMQKEIKEGIYIVTVKANDKTGRSDISTGAVNVKGIIGDPLANAIMKAETKAKRRVTLSICGLGILDETEIETIPKNNNPIDVTPTNNQRIYNDRWQVYENICKAINLIMTDKEKESDIKIRGKSDVSIKGLNELIGYFEKKYAIDIAKYNNSIKTPDLSLDVSEEANDKT